MPYTRRRGGYSRRSSRYGFRRTRLGSRPYRRRNGYGRFRRGRRTRSLGWYNRRYNFVDKWDNLYDYAESTAGTGFVSIAFTTAFNLLPNYALRANMGDQYKIYKWKFVVTPELPQKQDYFDYRGSWTAGTDIDNDFAQGQHALTVDYNDNVPIPNWSQVRTCNASTVVKNILKPLKFVIRPRIQKVLYETAIATGYSPGTGWINTSDPSVLHYGFKYSYEIPGFNTGIPSHPRYRYRVVQTVYYGLKGVQRTIT